MPYITKQTKREILSNTDLVNKPGELNFIFTRFITNYIETKGLSYQVINDILGALEGAKLEFYRRVAVPYEDAKIKENGDVY